MEKSKWRIGDWVKPWGKIVAMGRIGGERYYFMIANANSPSSITMLPECAMPKKPRGK